MRTDEPGRPDVELVAGLPAEPGAPRIQWIKTVATEGGASANSISRGHMNNNITTHQRAHRGY